MKYLLILIAFWFGCSPPSQTAPPAQLDMKSPELPQAQWERYLKSVMDDRLLGRKSAQNVAGKLGNLRWLATRKNVHPNQIQLAQRQLEKAAWSYLNGTTPSTYMSLGRTMARRFINSVKGRIKEPKSLTADGDNEQDKEFLTQVGTFTRDALRDGWTPTPMTALTECMFTALYMRDWMRPVEMRIAIQDYLDPLERYCELRWRVERAVRLPLKTRLEAIEELKAVDTYPGAYNRIVLLINASQLARASDLLTDFKGPSKAMLKQHLKMSGQVP